MLVPAGRICRIIIGDLAQMAERSLSMREALGSMPRFSICRAYMPAVYIVFSKTRVVRCDAASPNGGWVFVRATACRRLLVVVINHDFVCILFSFCAVYTVVSTQRPPHGGRSALVGRARTQRRMPSTYYRAAWREPGVAFEMKGRLN